MKKILLIDDNYHSADQGAFLNSFEIRFLQKNGYEVFTFSFPPERPSGAGDNEFFALSPQSRFSQKRGKFLGSGEVRKCLGEAIEKIRPDLIHCHLISKYPSDVYRVLDQSIPIIQTLHGPNFFCSTSWGCRKNSVPCEMGIGLKCYTRGCMPMYGTLLYSYLNSRTWRNLLSKVRVFHCPSRNIMNTALRLGIGNVKHIPLGINDRFLNIQRERPTGDPTAIFVGSLVEPKGVDVLIEAMKGVLEEIPNARLRIAGRGPLGPQLTRQAEDAALKSSVTFLGRIPHDELLQEYQAADVCVVPSVWQEQFGLVGPEAMACGLPCVGSDIGGIPEWLHHDCWGMLVPPGNKQHLASAMTTYLSHRDLAYQQGLAGQKFAREQYNAARYEQDMLQLIEECLAEAA